ncbi:uncharacterized protein LOC129308912 [Prosopis cineraria]|uniref:uncharacterized protein LOC129308912 n=1 Tax=Prosopis cineraria TaxID=364024 RepID=UPI0024108969|nr:uncharacterized protein LOC129308912 [Prosopis cineraria]
MENSTGNESATLNDRMSAVESKMAEISDMMKLLTEALKGRSDDNPPRNTVADENAVNRTIEPNRGSDPKVPTPEKQDSGIGAFNIPDGPGEDHAYMFQIPQVLHKEKELKEELGEMKDQLKALQGSNTWGSLDLKELCLTPEIDMSIWSQDEKFLINFFPESLTGAALTWYMQLDQTKIKRWKDLVDVFMRQYKFNLDTAPTREQLKAMTKKSLESFKEYAQRWRIVASQVQPPMVNSELCSYFIRALPKPFYQHMIGTHVTDFADLMVIGERIDIDIREGKIATSQAESSSRKNYDQKKKEGNVNYIQPIRQAATNSQVPYQVEGRNQRQQQFGFRPNKHGQDGERRNVQSRDSRPWPNFGLTNAELYHKLLTAQLLGPRPYKPLGPPYPAWYNPNVVCEYHMGAPGHSIEDCVTFKRNVLDLVDSNHIQLKEEGSSTLTTDPLPNHEKRVNAIEEEDACFKSSARIRMPMNELYAHLKEYGYMREMLLTNNISDQMPGYCEYHQEKIGHDIESCEQFKGAVRKMMALGIVSVKRGDAKVCMVEKKHVELVIKNLSPKERVQAVSFVINKASADLVPHKTPARISILSLILSSEAHRQALQEVLNQAFVQPNITPEKVASVMNVVKASSTISFSEEEVTETAVHQAKALHITLKCEGFIIARVLIDGGSALNVLPLSTFESLSLEASGVHKSNIVVRAFDGSRREVLGSICLSLEIGPSRFKVDFQLMNIDPSYTMLLGRPWIHSARAVPSTLHQKVKFISDGRIIAVKGEEEIMVSKPSSLPYIEAAEKDYGVSFQSLEVEGICGSTHNINSVVAKIMAKSGFMPGKGLGSHLQGITCPIKVLDNCNRQGLGYEPTLEDQMKDKASLANGKKASKLEIPHIKESFPGPSEVIYKPAISVISFNEDVPCRTSASIAVDDSNKVLANWEFEEANDVISLEDFVSSDSISHPEINKPCEDDSFVATDMHDCESDDEDIIQTFSKMLELSDKGICPHEEVIEMVNMGTEEDQRMLKIVDNPERETND